MAFEMPSWVASRAASALSRASDEREGIPASSTSNSASTSSAIPRKAMGGISAGARMGSGVQGRRRASAMLVGCGVRGEERVGVMDRVSAPLSSLSFSMTLVDATARGIQKSFARALQKQGLKVGAKLIQSLRMDAAVRKVALAGTASVAVMVQAPLVHAREVMSDRAESMGVIPPRKLSFAHPVEGAILTSRFGMRDGRWHKGIDLAAPTGTPVTASEGGKVTYSAYEPGYGNIMEVTHRDGYKTLYAHLSSREMAEGSAVRQGEVIGRVGNTGRSTGPHLHFEVRNHLDQVEDPERHVKTR